MMNDQLRIAPPITHNSGPVIPKTVPMTHDAGSASRKQIAHPELLQILMNSETSAMPRSLTNPSKAIGYEPVSPLSTLQQGRGTPQVIFGPAATNHAISPRQAVIHPRMEQEMQQEKKLAAGVLGGITAIFVLLVVVAKCFASDELSAAAKPASVIEKIPMVSIPSILNRAKGALERESRTSSITSLRTVVANRQLTMPPAALRPKLPVAVIQSTPAIPATAARQEALKAAAVNTNEVTPASPLHTVALMLPVSPEKAYENTQRSSSSAVTKFIIEAKTVDVLPAPPVATLTSKPVFTPQVAQRLNTLFNRLRTSFWSSERQLHTRRLESELGAAVYATPLSLTDPLSSNYYCASEAADEFISLVDSFKLQDYRIAPALYLGALSHYTLGHHKEALARLSRLTGEYSSYRRERYISDREATHPYDATPIKASIAKLVFHLRLQALPKSPTDAFGTLQQVTNDALSTLQSQQEYALWVEAKSNAYNIKRFDEARFGNEPDQRRAGALAPTMVLFHESYEQLLKPAIQQVGVKAIRDFWHGLADQSGQQSEFTQDQLNKLDSMILDGYRRQAQNLVARNDLNGARHVWKTVIAEYPGTAAEATAHIEIQNLTAQAAAKYRTEGDKKFNPAKQINVPQSEARAYFEKMYKEDPDGPGADYALLQWSRALGTEGNLSQAMAQLKLLTDKFAGSEFEAQAKYLIGFYFGHSKVKKYDEAIACMEQVAAEFPESPEAPEALWHAAYFSYLAKHPETGTRNLDALAKYKDSPRFRHIQELRTLLKGKQ